MEKHNLKVEVLVATMFQRDQSLINKMNIQSDAIITNQAENFGFEEVEFNEHRIKMYTFNEKGVGLNRNNALMRSSADYCVLADDDMVFEDNYPNKIIKLFNDNPNADVLILNINEETNNRYIIRKKFKVNQFNYMRFGAARIIFKREKITRNGIFFNLHFGGGTEHSAGEDILFLNSCLKENLQILAIPDSIASLSNDRPSTWFEGYTDKYFIDKGVLYKSISKKWAKLIALQFCIRRYDMYKQSKSFKEALKLINIGISKDF